MKLYKYLLLALALYPVTGQAMQNQSTTSSTYFPSNTCNLVENEINAPTDIKKEVAIAYTDFLDGVRSCNVNIIRAYIKLDADVNQADEDGNIPLSWAAISGYKDVVGLLLQADANVNQANKYGTMPLYWAAFKGHKDVVELLVAYNAKIDQETINVARNIGYEQIAAYLEENKDRQQILCR